MDCSWTKDRFFSHSDTVYGIVHIYSPFTRKQIVSLYFGRNVRARLEVAIVEMSGPPVFHMKAGRHVKCLAKDITSEHPGLFSTTFPKCRAPSRKAVDTIFKVFWYDSTRKMNPKFTDCEADALTATPLLREMTKSFESILLKDRYPIASYRSTFYGMEYQYQVETEKEKLSNRRDFKVVLLSSSV